jgi:hypothetical protein
MPDGLQLSAAEWMGQEVDQQGSSVVGLTGARPVSVAVDLAVLADGTRPLCCCLS